MIRKLTQEEYNNAADLSYQVYMECGRNDFTQEGIETFKSFVYDTSSQPCRTGEQTMDRNGRRRYQHPRTGNRTAFPAGTHPRQRQLFAPRQLHPQPLQRP